MYLAGTISVIAWWIPTQSPKNTGDMFKLVRWLQTVQNNFSFQQLSILLPSEQLVSQASSAKGVVCKISKRWESRNQCYTMQWTRLDIHTCKYSYMWNCHLASKKHHIDQKSSQKQFHSLYSKMFLGKHASRRTILHTHYKLDHLKSDGYAIRPRVSFSAYVSRTLSALTVHCQTLAAHQSKVHGTNKSLWGFC